MCNIDFFSTQLLQGRGAAHLHGVLWVDLKEIKFPGVSECDRATWNDRLCNAFLLLRLRQPLDQFEVEALELFTDMFVTCSLDPEVAGEEAVKIAKEVNWHGHSKSCRKKTIEGKCRFNYPRFPLATTTFIDINRKLELEEKVGEKRKVEILQKVAKALVDEENGKEVVSMAVKKIMEEKTKHETMAQRIQKLLDLAAGDGERIHYDEYRRAVQQMKFKGSTILLRRDLDEIFMNNYNTEMIEAWDANLDIQPVFDYYAVSLFVCLFVCLCVCCFLLIVMASH